VWWIERALREKSGDETALETGFGAGTSGSVGAGFFRQAVAVSRQKMPAKKKKTCQPGRMIGIYPKRPLQCKPQAPATRGPLGFLHQINTLAA
jgi:hypothetical protein